MGENGVASLVEIQTNPKEILQWHFKPGKQCFAYFIRMVLNKSTKIVWGRCYLRMEKRQSHSAKAWPFGATWLLPFLHPLELTCLIYFNF